MEDEVPKILVIDDQDDTLETITDILKSMIPGSILISSLSGKDGIKKAKEEQPDVIILDVVMPELDGFEVCQRLKADDETTNIPIILISGIKTDAENKIKGFNLGADVFLNKSSNVSELTAQIKVMLRIKAAEDKLRDDKINLEKLVQKRTKEHIEANKKLCLELSKFELEAGYNRQFLNLFRESLNEIYIFDAESLRFIEVNRTALLNLGYTMEELSKITPVEIKPNFTKHSYEKNIKPLRKNLKKKIVFVTSHKRKDGSIYTAEIHLQLAVFMLRKVFIATVFDITERKKDEKERTIGRQNFKMIHDPVGDVVSIIGRTLQ